jgi:hypothetical protein
VRLPALVIPVFLSLARPAPVQKSDAFRLISVTHRAHVETQEFGACSWTLRVEKRPLAERLLNASMPP